MQRLNRKSALDHVHDHATWIDQAAGTNPFAHSAWIMHFLDHIATDDWAIWAPEHAGQDRGAMFLYESGSERGNLQALTNYYASLYSPLLSCAGNREEPLNGVLDQLARHRPRFSSIQLAPLDADAVDTGLLVRLLPAHGWYARRYLCFGNWYLRCDGLSFADYMAARDSQLRNTWTRKSKKFHKATEGARLQIITEPAEVDAGMDAWQQIYDRSWKVAEPYPDFIRGWARICAGRGWLRLGLAWVGDVPIAAQFWFTMNRHAYIFKLAYDEDYSRWSAGTVLSALMFEHSLDRDRVVEIDYLTGDDPYKKTWVDSRRQRIGLIACNRRTLRGVARAAREWAGDLRSRWQLPAR